MGGIIEDFLEFFNFLKRLVQCRKQVFTCSCIDYVKSKQYYFGRKNCRCNFFSRLVIRGICFIIAFQSNDIFKMTMYENFYMGRHKKTAIFYEGESHYMEIKVINDGIKVIISEFVDEIYSFIDKHDLYSSDYLNQLLNVFFQSRDNSNIIEYHSNIIANLDERVIKKLLDNEVTSKLFLKFYPILKSKGICMMVFKTNQYVKDEIIDNNLLEYIRTKELFIIFDELLNTFYSNKKNDILETLGARLIENLKEIN